MGTFWQKNVSCYIIYTDILYTLSPSIYNVGLWRRFGAMRMSIFSLKVRDGDKSVLVWRMKSISKISVGFNSRAVVVEKTIFSFSMSSVHCSLWKKCVKTNILFLSKVKVEFVQASMVCWIIWAARILCALVHFNLSKHWKSVLKCGSSNNSIIGLIEARNCFGL